VSTETSKKEKRTPPRKGKDQHKRYRRKNRTLSIVVKAAVAVGVGGVAILVLWAIFFLNNNSGGGTSTRTGQAGKYVFQVGNPGPGEVAPPITLQSTDGSTFDLAALRGKTVLLFFQEGLSCQPCWDQIKDMEAQSNQFQALGIDTIVSITSDQLDALKQKVADEGLSTPVLSDPNLAVSHTYHANDYGMMGESSDGHTFIIVGPDGRIRWRADYGGPPNYTMYVPIPTLIADMKEGLRGQA